MSAAKAGNVDPQRGEKAYGEAKLRALARLAKGFDLGWLPPLRRQELHERSGVAFTPRYQVILYWSAADQAFIAEVPELPGCTADGATYREALANVEVVMEDWIETARSLGREIPEPRGR